jgi:acyl-CoA synthetase (AMP-forming)/AMP-acid ligase II
MAVSQAWALRATSADTADLYRKRGWWTDATLGQAVSEGLAAMSGVRFRVHSEFRPWTGTCADIDRAARSLAAALVARGLRPGEVVLSQLPNWAEAAVTFCAAAYAGAVVVPVVHFYGGKELSYILQATEPAVVVTPARFRHTEHLGMYADLLEHGSGPDPLWLVVGAAPGESLPPAATRFEDLLGQEPLTVPVETDPDTPALVAFTSGTTRNPKGVIHSHRTIVFESRQLDDLFPRGGPAQITGAPVGHFIGLLNAFLVPFQRHVPIELADVWNPGEVLRLMAGEGLGVSGASTYFLTSLLDDPSFTPLHLRYLPYAGLGGSPVPDEVTRRASALGIKVFRSYGSTEHPTITGCKLSDPEDKRLTTDGRCLPGEEIRLDDAGEILSRGPDLFVGYTDWELTKTVLTDDGWYRTGDIGVLDEEGYLTITDRVSDIIIRGGENVSAREIEDLLLRLDGVAEVSVVAAPDKRLGERAAAVVRPVPGHPAPTLAQLREFLDQAGLARQKWPELVYEVADFPRTASGKVQKFLLRAQVRRGELKAGAAE